MKLSKEELLLILEWHVLARDKAPELIHAEDRDLYDKLTRTLQRALEDQANERAHQRALYLSGTP